jgi:hypothetical protein
MRSTGVRLLVVAVCGFGLIAATHLPRPKDPIFGLPYDPARTQFEAAEEDLLSRCPELVNARWTRRMWVFARIDAAEGRFTVIGGYYVRRDAGSGDKAVETDDRGAVIQQTATECKLIGPAREVFDYPTEIAVPTLEALARDAAARFVRAYGGNQKFLAALSRQKVNLNDPRSRVLREAVNAVR